jgi:DNA-binding NarL/FixJ family response regulator
LIVGRNSALRDGLLALMGEQDDIQVIDATDSIADALQVFIDSEPEVVVVDADMPCDEGLEAIRRMSRQSPNAIIIALVTYEWDQLAMASLAAGAVAFLPKDRIAERLLSLVRESSGRS